MRILSHMPRLPILTRATADKHELYERAVQNSEGEIDFVRDTFRSLRGTHASRLREDFCGTAASACEWVRRGPTHRAVGLDLHAPTLASGRKRHVAKLTSDQQKRITLLKRNVLDPGQPSVEALGGKPQIVLAMNFSYWIFKTRPVLRDYFAAVRRSLDPRGVFFLDHYGGSDAYLEMQERRRIGGPRRGFTYVWDQALYNPVTADKVCHIHFEFHKGPAWRNAFTYHWRLWSLVEVRELLVEAGFRDVHVYWEGDDGRGGGNGIFRKTTRGEACRCAIAYLAAIP